MITVQIRKQGGAAIMTIPSDVLRILNLGIGETLALDVTKEGFTAHPAKTERKRYSLSELLYGVTPKKIKALNKKTHWAREGKAIGREQA
jgi:antitoxin ChpS